MNIISNNKQHKLFLFIIAFAVLFIDQLMKYIFANSLEDKIFYRNYDFFWNLPLDYFLVSLTFLIIFFSIKKKYLTFLYKKSLLGFLLLFFGILSNSIDAIWHGYVLDYVIFYDLFSFNIADLSILFGSLILGWKIFLK